MRKRVLASIIIALCIILTACGNAQKSNLGSDDKKTESDQQSEFFNNGDDSSEVTNKEIKYISDRRTQYNEAQKRYIVFFGLQTEDNEYVDASGCAEIIIKDKSGYVLFEKKINFSSADFTDWTNQQWDSARYMCGLYINQTEIEGSASSSGDLSLKVTLEDGTWFDAYTMQIFDLPSIQVNISLPQLPATHKDVTYSYTSTFTVLEMEYKTNISYNGTASVEFSTVLRLESKTNKQNESNYVHVGYKLYDSKGIVVNSGNMLFDPIAIGESSKDTMSISGLDPREEYTLVLMDAS